MIRFFALIILIFSGFNSFTQQCGYDKYFLFVVNPHFQNDFQKVPKLTMYLVDENDQPIRVSVTYAVNNEWMTRSDTLFFWNQKPIVEYGAPLCRRQYYNIGNHYVVAFSLETYDLKDPSNYPIYKLKIEGYYDELSMETYPAQFFYLPLQKSVRICNNGLLDDYKYSEPVKTLDGNVFEPIDIVINKQQDGDVPKIEEEHGGGLLYTVRFDYLTNDNQMESVNTFTVNTAKIYDTRNGKLHQEIYIPSKSKSVNKESKSIIEFEDYYDRGLTEALDFSVQIDSWRDLDYMVSREKTNFYIFNISNKKYELDTALSNYDDVFYYKPLKKMRRYDYKLTEVSKISLTYQFNHNQWQLIDKSESFFKPTPPPIKYSPKACVLFNEQSHTLPGKAIIGDNATKLITDTFWLYNGCDDTVFIAKVQSPTRDFFSINQVLLPKQKTPLIFNGILTSSFFDFNTKDYACYLTLEDNTILTFIVVIPVISNNMSVFYNKDSTINYAIGKQENKRYTNAIFTYPNGKLKAKGLVLDGDTALKAGKWSYYKSGDWRIDEVVYSKAIYLSAFDENYMGQHANFKIKVLENGKWFQPIFDKDDDELRFFITAKTDSIMAYTDTTSYTFALHYKELPELIIKQIFLLKPNQRTLKIGYYTMPFNTIEDSYALIPNYSVFKNLKTTTYKLTDSIIKSLRSKYPKLTEVYISKNQRGIGLAYLTKEEKKQLLSQLEQDSSIGFVCKLFTISNSQKQGYCNNIIYVEANTDKIEIIRKLAHALGFVDIKEDVMRNRFMLTYNRKIIDEDFFEAFKKLSENKFVIGAFFNTYMEAEPDVDN